MRDQRRTGGKSSLNTPRLRIWGRTGAQRTPRNVANPGEDPSDPEVPGPPRVGDHSGTGDSSGLVLFSFFSNLGVMRDLTSPSDLPPSGEGADHGAAIEPEGARADVARGACCPACGAPLAATGTDSARGLSPTLRRVLAGL